MFHPFEKKTCNTRGSFKSSDVIAACKYDMTEYVFWVRKAALALV